MVQPVFEADQICQLDGSGGAFFGLPSEVVEGQFDILLDGELGNEVEALENEAQVCESHFAELIVVEGADIVLFEDVGSGGYPVEAAQDVEHCAFAGAAGPHYGPEAARLKRQRYSGQGVYLLGAHLVNLADIFEFDYRAVMDVVCGGIHQFSPLGPLGGLDPEGRPEPGGRRPEPWGGLGLPVPPAPPGPLERPAPPGWPSIPVGLPEPGPAGGPLRPRRPSGPKRFSISIAGLTNSAGASGGVISTTSPGSSPLLM